jgi:hypothetical protein
VPGTGLLVVAFLLAAQPTGTLCKAPLLSFHFPSRPSKRFRGARLVLRYEGTVPLTGTSARYGEARLVGEVRPRYVPLGKPRWNLFVSESRTSHGTLARLLFHTHPTGIISSSSSALVCHVLTQDFAVLSFSSPSFPLSLPFVLGVSHPAPALPVLAASSGRLT